MDGITTECREERISEGKTEETDSLLTIGEAASFLNVHINTVRRWSNLGLLKSFRIGHRGDRRFWKKEVINSVNIFKHIGLIKSTKVWSGIDGVIKESTAGGISDIEVEETDSLLTVGEVAIFLKIHINTVRRWGNLGILPSFRIGLRGDRRFRKRDVMNFLLK